MTTSLIFGAVLATTGFVCTIFVFWKRLRTRRTAPPGVVVLYQIGRGPFAPSISPFPLKLETFLRMSKIPYMNDHSAKFSSKRKTPWMEVDGVAVADSQFCIEYLKQTKGVDVNEHLTEEELGIARAFQKMTEENLYWTMCIEMFGDDTSVVEKVIPYRGLKLWFTIWFLRRVISKETWGHGIGRHNQEEVWSIAVGDMTAISNFLGKKTYMMGDEPSEVDCAIFGMLAMILWNMPTSKHENYVKEHLPNLVTYCDNMKEKYWPDWDRCIQTSKTFVNDDGEIYNY